MLTSHLAPFDGHAVLRRLGEEPDGPVAERAETLVLVRDDGAEGEVRGVLASAVADGRRAVRDESAVLAESGVERSRVVRDLLPRIFALRASEANRANSESESVLDFEG